MCVAFSKSSATRVFFKAKKKAVWILSSFTRTKSNNRGTFSGLQENGSQQQQQINMTYKAPGEGY